MANNINELQLEALDKLKSCPRDTPYMNYLYNDIIKKQNLKGLSKFNIEFILKNFDYKSKDINKTVKLTDWYGKQLQEKLDIEFTPEKLSIKRLCGETESFYYCIIKYRKNMEPLYMFILKNGIITDFLTEDYHNIEVDFERYNRLSKKYHPESNRIIKPHQEEGVQFLLSRKKCILADDMGLGKTLTLSVAAIEGNFDSVLIICPASLKTNWKEELSYYAPESDISIIEGIQGMTKPMLEKKLGYSEGKSGKSIAQLQDEFKQRGKWIDNRFVIINFDILDDVYQKPKTRSKENIQIAYNNSPMLQYLDGRKSLIIIDEAHKLSNMKAGRYDIIKDLIKRSNPDSIYLSTGTPITNDPKNYYNLLALIGAPITSDWKAYMERYCNTFKMPINETEKKKKKDITDNFCKSKGKNNWYDLTNDEKQSLNKLIDYRVKQRMIVNGGRNLEELREKTSSIYLRRVKEDLNSIPSKNILVKTYVMNTEQQSEYDKLWDEYEKMKKEENPDKEMNKELIEGGLYRRYLSNQMVSNTIALADKCINKGEKVVIACCYDEELYTLKNYYGDKCVIYNGKMLQKEKDNAKNRFMNDPEIMVFIGNIKSCGVGITLTVSRVLIFNNFEYTYSDNSQMQDRIHRIGQTRDVYIYYQYFVGTQYEKMWNTVLSKKLISDTVIIKETEK